MERWISEKNAKEFSHDHIDNFRLAALDDPEAMHLFKNKEENGCCGSETFTFDLFNANDILKDLISDNKTCKYNTFKIGYNWGH